MGLSAFDPQTDEALVNELLQVLSLVETDITLFYRLLADFECQSHRSDDSHDEALMAPLMEAYYQPDQLTDAHRKRIGNWLRSYNSRVIKDSTTDVDRRQKMNAANP